jgi:hypothetical protein
LVARTTRGGHVVKGSIDGAAANRDAARAAAKRDGRAVAPKQAISGGTVKPADAPPADIRYPACAVPRNDVHRQVLQPSPGMVEWAVDEAVHGTLTVQRPANYGQTGEPAYTPQGMFPLPAGNVRIPAQVLLGILAQESNFSQASWHGVPGDAAKDRDTAEGRSEPQVRAADLRGEHEGRPVAARAGRVREYVLR